MAQVNVRESLEEAGPAIGDGYRLIISPTPLRCKSRLWFVHDATTPTRSAATTPTPDNSKGFYRKHGVCTRAKLDAGAHD